MTIVCIKLLKLIIQQSQRVSAHWLHCERSLLDRGVRMGELIIIVNRCVANTAVLTEIPFEETCFDAATTAR